MIKSIYLSILLFITFTLSNAQTVVHDTLWIDDFSADTINTSVFKTSVSSYNANVDSIGWFGFGNNRVMVYDVDRSEYTNIFIKLDIATNVLYDSIVISFENDGILAEIETQKNCSFTIPNTSVSYSSSDIKLYPTIQGTTVKLCESCSGHNLSQYFRVPAYVHATHFERLYNDSEGDQMYWSKFWSTNKGKDLGNVNDQMRHDFCTECANDLGNGQYSNYLYFECYNNATIPNLFNLNTQALFREIVVYGYKTDYTTSLEKLSLGRREIRQYYDLRGRIISETQAINQFVICEFSDGSRELIFNRKQ